MSTPVWLFRYDNGEGSAKDWAYPVNTSAQDDQLTVFFGRSGSALRQANTPAQSCRHQDPAYEAQCRSQAKVDKGYAALGEWGLDDKRRIVRAEVAEVEPEPVESEPVESEPVESEPVELSPRWYWRAPVLIDASLYEALVELAKRLYAAGWLTATELHDAQDQPHHLWLRITGGQAHGVVRLETSQLIQIASLLSLSRSHDEVHLADQNARTVTDWPSEVPLTHEVLGLLGLHSQSTWYGLQTDTTDEWFF